MVAEWEQKAGLTRFMYGSTQTDCNLYDTVGNV